MSLKNFVYMTFEEVADWLKIDYKTIGLEGDTKATKVIQDLTFTAKLNGLEGNDIQVEYVGGGTAGSEVVTVTGKKISVQIENTVSTSAQIKAAIEASTAAAALVSIALNATNTQTIQALTNLTGGAYHGTYKPAIRRVIEDLMNASCEKIERLIDGSVIEKEFQEDMDGGDSNVFVPNMWPIRSITELKVDYVRVFGPDTVVSPSNYFIRGGADVRQVTGDVQIKIVGNDVVLYDDHQTVILGSLLIGSKLGAVRIKYKAGWAKTADDVPSDLRLATKQLIEYWWLQRENRDINVSSKGVKGESYTKLKDGIPEQIHEMIQEYVDTSMGARPVMQRNVVRTY